MKAENSRKYYIDYLKGIAASFVVIGHCITFFTQNYSYAYCPFWLSLIGVLVSSVHVPMFFLIAGYLCHPKPYSEFVKQRSIRILIPYFSFSVLKLFYNAVASRSFAHGGSYIEVLYDTFILGGAYWFVYCMFFIYLLAPIGWQKRQIENKSKNGLLITLCLVLFVINILFQDYKIFAFPSELIVLGFKMKDPLFQIERVCIYLPYFLIGMLIQNNQAKFCSFIRKIKVVVVILLLILALALGCLVSIGIINKGYFFKSLIALSLMFCLYRLMLLVPDGVKSLSTPGKYSLQIMFFDSFFRVVLFAFISHFIKLNAEFALLIAAIDIVLSCLASFVLSKVPIINFLIGLSGNKIRK